MSNTKKKSVRDKSYGIIPVWVAPDSGPEYLLVKHNGGHWGFPKGHREKGESKIQAAVRELEEEAGVVPAEVFTEQSYREQYIFQKKRSTVTKDVTYWLARITCPEAVADPSEIAEVGWFSYADARAIMTFAEGKVMLDEVNEELPERLALG